MNNTNLPLPENNLPDSERLKLVPLPTEYVESNPVTNDGLVNDDPQVVLPGETPQPQLCLSATCVPGDGTGVIDLGKLPWSKCPIREITPLVWFKYEVEDCSITETEHIIVYNVIDGNGRTLFCVNEEGMANFFVNAANIYVQAGSTQL